MEIKNNKSKFNSNNNKNNNRNKANIGIEILRVILCFWILTFHLYKNKKRRKHCKILNTYYHVPTFMIISFYLTNKLFSIPNIIKIKQRITRLLFPYLMLPIIKLLFSVRKISFKLFINRLFINLLVQYITGYRTYVIKSKIFKNNMHTFF